MYHLFSGCLSAEITFAINSIHVGTTVFLPFGDHTLSCSAEGALSYRWSSVDDSSVTYGQTVLLQYGQFYYTCTAYVECRNGADTMICPLTKSIRGFINTPGRFVVSWGNYFFNY